MIYLSYHPCFDAFHCIFRTIRIFRSLGVEKMEVDRLRILDYYLLFPWRASAIRLPRADLPLRAIAKKLEANKGYATMPEGAVLLGRMRAPQLAALQTLVNDGVLSGDILNEGNVRVDGARIPSHLAEIADVRNGQEGEVVTILAALLKYPLLGGDGLKGRTGLMEFRYDNV